MPDSFIPPTSVRNAAKRGLALRQKYGRGGLTTQQAGAQGIGSGVQRASDLANGKGITLDTIKRMVAFFSRHEGNKNTPPEKGNGMISWLLWGGDAGRSWAESVLKNQESTKAKADAPNYRPAGPNLERCSTCRFFKARQCTKYKFTAQASYTCDAWRPNVEKSQALRDLWGKESEEQKEVSAIATAVPAHGPGGLLSPLGLGKQKRKKRGAKTVKADKPTKTIAGAQYPATAFLVVGDEAEPSTWHLPVKRPDGTPDRARMGAAFAALTSNYRGQSYQGEGKAQALVKLRKLYQELGEKLPGAESKEASTKPGSNHGPSIKNPKVYEALLRRGMPKAQAAAISNAMGKRGKEFIESVKHGSHNQAAHGFRFGSTPSLEQARRYRKAGVLPEYSKRSRERSGTKPAKQRNAEKPKIKPVPDKSTVTQILKNKQPVTMSFSRSDGSKVMIKTGYPNKGSYTALGKMGASGREINETFKLTASNLNFTLNELRDRGWGMFYSGGLPSSNKETTTPSTFTVYKDSKGQYRWLAISSNAYRDKDGEIVSLKALQDDIARSDKEGDYGPLRFWHMPGVDIGDCDFNMLHGKMLLESGTFTSPAIAQRVARKASDYQMSIGFRHPDDEPDKSGVFHNIRRFERSLVPAGRAANPFTAFSVSEQGETVKHGSHNQASHGFRFGKAPSLTQARRYRKAGVLDEYSKRSRDRSGTKPAKERNAAKPKRTNDKLGEYGKMKPAQLQKALDKNILMGQALSRSNRNYWGQNASPSAAELAHLRERTQIEAALYGSSPGHPSLGIPAITR